MANNRSDFRDDDHQVIKFRPRTSAKPPKAEPAPEQRPLQQDSLSQYERGAEPDDYGHRMRMNIAAALFTMALVGFGIWLAISIADLRRTQDCLLTGRRDCAAIPVPAP